MKYDHNCQKESEMVKESDRKWKEKKLFLDHGMCKESEIDIECICVVVMYRLIEINNNRNP